MPYLPETESTKVESYAGFKCDCGMYMFFVESSGEKRIIMCPHCKMKKITRFSNKKIDITKFLKII